MKKNITLSIIVLLLLNMAGNAQSSPVLKYLPDNANMVFAFNPVKIANKVPGETFRQSFMYRELMKKNNDELKAFMADPTLSGVDFTQDLLLLITVDTSNAHPSPSLMLMGALKNEALFTVNIGKLESKDNHIQTYGTNKMLLSEKGGPSLAWNNEIFAMSLGMSGAERSELMNVYQGNDTMPNVDFEKRMKDVLYHMQKIRRNHFFELLTPRAASNPFANARLIDMLNSNGDIKMWSDGQNLGSMMMGRANPLAGLMSSFSKLQGQSKVTITSFETGKIVSISHSYLNDKMAAVYQHYPTIPQNTDLLRRLPKGRLLGLMSSTFNPAMSKEMLQNSGLNTILDSLKTKLPFDLSGLTNVFGSNMLLAVLQSDDISPTDSVTKKMGGIQLVMATPIVDKERFTTLKSNFLHLWDSLSHSEMGEKMLKGMVPVVKTNDNLLVLSLSPETATAFLNNPGTEPVPEWLAQYKDHPMIMNINFRELIKMAMSKQSRNGIAGKEAQLLNLFDKMIFYGGEFENGSLNNTMEMQFGNPTENAFTQIFDLINHLAESGSHPADQMGEEAPSATMEGVKLEAIKVEEKKSDLPPPPPPPKNRVPAKKTKG